MNIIKNSIVRCVVSIFLCMPLTGYTQPVQEMSVLELSVERINHHKKEIEQLVLNRKRSRKVMRVLQAAATVLTIGELVLFARDIFTAFNESENAPAAALVAGQRKHSHSWAFLLTRAAVIATCQAITTSLMNRYYENTMQEESISWYVLTKAFYKVNSTEFKKQLEAHENAIFSEKKYYHAGAINACNRLIEELEKVIAFMEYKIEYLPVKNRPEARSLINHFVKTVKTFIQSVTEHSTTKLLVPVLLADLAKLEHSIDGELLTFSRLEGTVIFNERQYNALVQAQGM